MFGLLRPCAKLMDHPRQREWMSHFCGLCLALRDDFGQSTRLATNYDSLVLSVLTAAQDSRGPQRRTAGPCPLRGMRTASVVNGSAARLAALASVLLATAKINDHIDDGDGLAAHKSVAMVGRRVSARLEAKALRLGEDIGFDATGLLATVREQSAVESRAVAGTPLTTITRPTEDATAALFAHTAVLTGHRENTEPLARAGRAFGRLAHLVDAVSDLERDAEAGSWNPLTATETPVAQAHRLCHAAIDDIDEALAHAGISADGLTRSLLVDHAAHAMRHSHSDHGHQGHGHPNHPDPYPPPKRGFLAGCGAAILVACTCQCCCSGDFEGPWSRKRHEGCCHSGSCDCPCDSNCCSCCGCGDCCDGCDA